MSVLSVLSGAATAAGKAFEGYGLDQRTAAANLLAQRKQADEETANRVRNIVALAGIDPDVQGQLSGARSRAEVPAHLSEFGQEAPIRTKEAIDTAAGTAPITEGVHEHERLFDNKNQPPDKPALVPTQNGIVRVPLAGPAGPVTNPDGTLVVKAGGAAGANAPLAARAGQVGLALRAAGDVIPLHEALTTSGVPFGAETEARTAQGQGVLARVPFVPEVANRLLNSGDNAQYARYNAALPNLLLGATHAISGARINQQQLETLEQGLRLKNGDTPQVSHQKLSNLVDFLNSMRASLPSSAISGEESGIDPQTLRVLRSHGYGGAPTGAAFGMLKQVLPDFTPTLGSPDAGATGPSGGTPDHTAMTDEQFKAAWNAGQFRKP